MGEFAFGCLWAVGLGEPVLAEGWALGTPVLADRSQEQGVLGRRYCLPRMQL